MIYMFLSNDPSSGDINSSNLSCYNFSDLFSFHLRTIDHLTLKLLMNCRRTTSFKTLISNVQDFGKFELSPMLKA